MSGVLIYNATASIRKSGAAMNPTVATAAERDIYSTAMTGAVYSVAVLALERSRSLKLAVMATAAVNPRSTERNREAMAANLPVSAAEGGRKVLRPMR